MFTQVKKQYLYDIDLKTEAIEYAKSNGNRVSGRKFRIIREWRLQEVSLLGESNKYR